MKVCKGYCVIAITKSPNGVDPATNKIRISNGTRNIYQYYDTLEAAQAQADVNARAGYLGVIFESKEFHQVEPLPVIVQRVQCCNG